MNSDCLIVDMQGFKDLRNRFILKEFAFATSEHTQVFLLKPPFTYNDLYSEEKKQVSWIQRNRGIYWNEGYIVYEEFKKYIKPFLEKHRNILVKGLEKIRWMEEICSNCNIIELGEKGCPNFTTLYNSFLNSTVNYNCAYHKKYCALKNVISLRKWFIENNMIVFF